MARPRKIVEENEGEVKETKKTKDKSGDLMSRINEKFGKGTVVSGDKIESVQLWCSTGSYKLDYVLGCGGLPKGKIFELYGANSNGKTTMSMIMLREAQKACPEKKVAVLDFENSFDRDYAINLGLDLEKLLLIRSSKTDKDSWISGEQGFDILEQMANDGSVSVVMIDSVHAMMPYSLKDNEYTDQHMGTHAKMLSQGLQKLMVPLTKANMTLLFINQLRQKIGVMFGPTTTTTGGEGLKFYAHCRLEVLRRAPENAKKELDSGEGYTYFDTTIKVVKSKIGPPMKKVETRMFTGKNGKWGIDIDSELFDFAISLGIIQKSGAWYSLGETKLGQGKENSMEELKKNEKLYESVVGTVKSTIAKKQTIKAVEIEDEGKGEEEE